MGVAPTLERSDVPVPQLVGLALRAGRERALTQAQTAPPLDRLRKEPFSCLKP